MTGYYSTMRAKGSLAHKSRSVDFSDLLFIPSSETEQGVAGSRDATRVNKTSSGLYELGLGGPEEKISTGGGASFRVVLSRSCSTASKRFTRKLEGQTVGAHCGVVKKALSMRRSSSVSERYCRIHDQSVMQMDCEEEDEDDLNMTGAMKKSKSRSKNKAGKIVKACKRFFGLG